ncbi:MAG: tRNA (adenosine(37)-N6)-dimethylallyltransferase MiaA [Lachnospiraceae bacterium]|nr:tRNA (adenosine(37)-N6)-dimethylallyltransferase MiaA [Lachnospiraceae bacterium]
MPQKDPLVILTGPTAAGKTALSVELAKRIGGEIISADSMQVYKGMDIGTAKVTPKETKGIRHHLIDVLEPEEDFNVFLFQTLAKEAANDIISRGKIPIVAGGTGFYIQALLYGVEFTENDDNTAIREKYMKIAKDDPDLLYKELMEKDPESCEIIHKNNIKRVVRALEYYELTGEKISGHNAEQRAKDAEWNFAYFVLEPERSVLYDRINRRVDVMMENGLVDEVKALKDRGLTKDHVSMKGLGYKEILDHLDGAYDLETAVEILKRDTRHFAKRQLTWFRREKDVLWLDRAKSDEELLGEIINILTEKGIVK